MSDNVTYLSEPPRKRIGKSPVLKDGDAVRVPLFLMDGKARVADNPVNDARTVKDAAYAEFVCSLSDATARVSLSDMAAKVPAGVDRHRAAESFAMIDRGDVAGGIAGVTAMIGSHRIASALDSDPDRRGKHEAAIDFLTAVIDTVSVVKGDAK